MRDAHAPRPADRDETAALVAAVREAAERGEVLAIRGGGSRSRWCPAPAEGARVLAMAGHRGIVHHAPTELVVTARAGTSIEALEAAVAATGQVLPFEPPRHGSASTVGGLVATGQAGPARPFWGGVRDALLGVRLVDGEGRVGRFGGEVMKNVAGYDVTRLAAGAFGTTGLLLDVSLRLKSAPERVVTQRLELDADAALAHMAALSARPLPISGLAWHDGVLRVRLAGNGAGVAAALATVGGEADPGGGDFWRELRDGCLPVAEGDRAPSGALWCLSLPARAPQPPLPARWLIDWGGHRRWAHTEADPQAVQAIARDLGGHALRLSPSRLPMPQPRGLSELEARVRAAMDPAGVFRRAGEPGA